MNRRTFIKAAATVPILSSFSNNIVIGKNISFEEKPHSIIKPPKLKEGDTIGLIAPGSFIREDELNESVKNLEALGFKVYYSDNILIRDGYLGGSDEVRAGELNFMFREEKIRGIVCARGGYGCARILPMLDYDAIIHNPKPLIGYSDVTALLTGIFNKTGLVCFHGPVGISTFNEFSIYNFRNVLMEAGDLFEMNCYEDNSENESYRITPIRTGEAAGELIGGNLSIITSLEGTPYGFDTKGKIIFLEEVGEEPYRIDRMLTHLRLSGKLQQAAGIALGVFKNCEVKSQDPSFKTSFNLMEVLNDRLYDLGIPVIYGMSFGHISNKFTLPVGIMANLNVLNRTLTLLESAVI